MQNDKINIWQSFRQMANIGNYRMLADTGECVVIRVENDTGEGDMIIRNANQIFVVDKGKIVQRGTHEELMKEEGIYRRFVDLRKSATSWKL